MQLNIVKHFSLTAKEDMANNRHSVDSEQYTQYLKQNYTYVPVKMACEGENGKKCTHVANTGTEINLLLFDTRECENKLNYFL